MRYLNEQQQYCCSSPRRVILLVFSISLLLLLNNTILLVHHQDASSDCSHLPPHHHHTNNSNTTNTSTTEHKIKNNKAAPINTINMTMIGIALNAECVSDSAINFLLELACIYNIRSYILLGEGYIKPLKKKMYGIAYHSYLHTNIIEEEKGTRGNDALNCMDNIRIQSVASQEDVLLNMTKHYIHNITNTNNGRRRRSTQMKSTLLNNALDTNNRIASIKRSREYQRQQLLLNKVTWGGSSWEWKDQSSSSSVIGVLDLDLLAYPSVSHVLETASRYIIIPPPIPSSSSLATTDDNEEKKFHAICANGIQIISDQRGGIKQSYYDTFSTILLPNTWLYRESDRLVPSRGELEGENVTLSQMSQTQILEWFVKRGTTKKKGNKQQQNNSGTEAAIEANTKSSSSSSGDYDPVSVRSCFNGFTMYRSDIFFNSQCRYDLYNRNDRMYASKRERHTCEHVVFNECLRRMTKNDNTDSIRIAVMPDMKTLWHLV